MMALRFRDASSSLCPPDRKVIPVKGEGVSAGVTQCSRG